MSRRIAAGSSLRGLSSVTINEIRHARRDRRPFPAVADIAVAAAPNT
jgi:hypothetical protein